MWCPIFSSKNIVLSIKKKLSPDLFESQIQQRLIEYIGDKYKIISSQESGLPLIQ